MNRGWRIVGRLFVITLVAPGIACSRLRPPARTDLAAWEQRSLDFAQVRGKPEPSLWPVANENQAAITACSLNWLAKMAKYQIQGVHDSNLPSYLQLAKVLVSPEGISLPIHRPVNG